MRIRLLPAIACLAVAACGGAKTPAAGSATTGERPKTHDALVTLFNEWRAFQRPTLTGGVPDYTAKAMAAQQSGLASWQQRLAAFDTTGWSVADQVDYHIIRAEMNGMDFDHRVMKPWVNNPAFYVTFFTDESDQPAREGPFAWGAVELWSYKQPLSAADAAAVDSGLARIPGLLQQAQQNLTGNQKDLWTWGVKPVQDQAKALEGFIASLPADQAALKASAQAAKDATDTFAAWIESQKGSKTGPSGIGVANYDWYLKHVQLLPYTWHDLVLLMDRELARSWAYLGLEEVRNAAVPPQRIVASPAEFDKRFNDAVTEYMGFLKAKGVITVKGDMEARLRARIGSFSTGKRHFFAEVDYRDPEVMRTHGFHWFDKGAMAAGYGNPIRNGALLYNIFNNRTEGLATGWEEMMMGAGMFDGRPRARELVLILLAERAARALGDLRMHGDGWSLDAAAKYASTYTPRGWLGLDTDLVWFEQHLYLTQPTYGVSYVIGKIEVEKAMQARMMAQGEKFTVGGFMDDLTAMGQIPVSLIRWQMSGQLPDDVKAMLSR